MTRGETDDLLSCGLGKSFRYLQKVAGNAGVGLEREAAASELSLGHGQRARVRERWE